MKTTLLKYGCAWLLALLAATHLCAQTRAEVETQKKEINKVKKSSAYLYGESTLPTQEEALKLAYELLDKEIEQYVRSKKKFDAANLVVTRNTSSLCSKITLPRGNMFRAFVYIKKSDIIPSDNAGIRPLEKAAQPAPETTAETLEATQAPVPEALQRLLRLSTFDQIEPCLTELKQRGLVADFKKYADLAQPEDYTLIIYNRQAQVEAILSDGAERVNLKTNTPDNVGNYKGRGAIGVKINK